MTILHFSTHPFHVFRIHRIVFGSNHQSWRFDFFQALRNIPIFQSGIFGHAKLAMTLHVDINVWVQMFESTIN